jgi:hypothetical protein
VLQVRRYVVPLFVFDVALCASHALLLPPIQLFGPLSAVGCRAKQARNQLPRPRTVRRDGCSSLRDSVAHAHDAYAGVRTPTSRSSRTISTHCGPTFRGKARHPVTPQLCAMAEREALHATVPNR